MTRSFGVSLSLMLGTTLTITACGGLGGPGKKQSAAAPKAADSKAEAAGLLADQASTAGSTAPAANPVTDAAHVLARAVSTQIAACAGYADEEAAVQAKTDDLLAKKATPEEATAALAPLLAALDAKTAAAQDATLSCLTASRTSPPAQSLLALITACYTQPTTTAAPEKGKKHGEKTGLGKVVDILTPPIPGLEGKGRPHQHEAPNATVATAPDLLLPAPELATYDTDACKAALSASQAEVAALAAATPTVAAPAASVPAAAPAASPEAAAPAASPEAAAPAASPAVAP